MSVADRANKRMKGDGGPIGAGPPPPDGYYGQHPPPGAGRYPPYGGPAGPPMGSGYSMWQQGHPPPQHSWGHGGSSGPPPPHGSMYQQGRGPGPSMGQDRGSYGGSYSRGHPPPMSGPPGPGGVRRVGKPPGPPPSSRPPSKGPGPEGPPSGAPPSDGNGPPPPSGYQGGYYPSHQAPYGNGPYSNGPPPPMHHAPPQSYGNPPPPSNGMYGNSPARQSQPRPGSSTELLGGGTGVQSTTTGTDAPDFDNLFSPRATGGPTTLDDDGNSSVATGGGGANAKDKGRGSYKCGRCGVPKKGHVCPYQPKVTRKIGEPLPEMRSAAIQVEMDEFMTLRRLNLRIQGFPESYASEPHGEDMVVGEPHQHPSMNAMSPLPPQQQQHGDIMNVADNGTNPSLPSSAHDPATNVLAEDPIIGAA